MKLDEEDVLNSLTPADVFIISDPQPLTSIISHNESNLSSDSEDSICITFDCHSNNLLK